MQSKQSREEDVAVRSAPRVISGADELFSGKRLRKQASDQPSPEVCAPPLKAEGGSILTFSLLL